MPFPYGPGYENVLGRREFRSGNNLYYSSGGSNGGLSPPPAMALLSGIPPPDLGIKKPMPSTRPKSEFRSSVFISFHCFFKNFSHLFVLHLFFSPWGFLDVLLLLWKHARAVV